MIVLDTSVLSLSFRRRPRRAGKSEPPEATRLRRLIESDEPLAIPGLCFQELLSGVSDLAQFRRLRRLLEGFPLLLAREETHEAAARIHWECRSKGVQSSGTDCLIAAHAIEAGGSLFTADRDFERISRCCPLRLSSYT